MFSRYALVLAAVVLGTALISFGAADEVDVDTETTHPGNPLLAAAVRLLAGAFGWAAENCLQEAANNCKDHWRNAQDLISCGRGFLESNRGRCVVG